MPELQDDKLDAKTLLKQHGDAVSLYLKEMVIRFGNGVPAKLIESIEYSLLAGGKRLRPALVLESFKACGGKDAARHNALAAAAAMELVHTFSLVHDDLPAMDDDDFRRGRATNHKVFGEALAILTGDAMLAMAFEVIASEADSVIAPKLIQELARAAGPAGMIGGQVLDMAGENQSLSLEQLQQIHRMKTGALLTVSCRLGAMAAGVAPNQLAALTEFGKHLGLAFQIVDDILDVTATPEQLGKATAKDSHRGKNTYPVLLGVEESQNRAKNELNLALLAVSPLNSFADGLCRLANFVVYRQS